MEELPQLTTKTITMLPPDSENELKVSKYYSISIHYSMLLEQSIFYLCAAYAIIFNINIQKYQGCDFHASHWHHR